MMEWNAPSNAKRCKIFVASKGSGKSTLERIFVQILGYFFPNCLAIYINHELIDTKNRDLYRSIGSYVLGCTKKDGQT